MRRSSSPEVLRPIGARVARVLVSTFSLLVVACAPTGGLLDEHTLSGMGAVPAGVGYDPGAAAASRDTPPSTIQPEAVGEAVIVAGRVNGKHDYELFTFGPSQAGDRWLIERADALGAAGLVVALFDENMHLLARWGDDAQWPLEHFMRHDCAAVSVGVATAADGVGGSYRLHVSRHPGTTIPAPRAQLVWLNFGGAINLTVGDCQNMSFGRFDAGILGESYAGCTREIKQAIAEAMRRAYADYDVTIVTSDETAAPAEVHAAIHFGYDDPSQLGQADNVDAYNADPGQNAIVFVERFARYWTMKLSPAEMGQMIGNTACHELGHLLGLHHTYAADHIMDTSAGGAYDMAGERNFAVADLDPDVFPIGKLDARQVLADTVGLRPE